MKKISSSMKIVFVIVLLTGLFVMGCNADRLQTAHELLQSFIQMLQEFAAKDIVGIV